MSHQTHEQVITALKNGTQLEDIQQILSQRGLSPAKIAKEISYAQWSLDPINMRHRSLDRLWVILPALLWSIGLFLPGFIATDGAGTFSGFVCFLDGFIFAPILIFTPMNAWLVNVLFFIVCITLLAAHRPNKNVLAVLSTIGACWAPIIFTISELPVRSEGAENPVIVGAGAYFWLAAIGVLAVEMIARFIWRSIIEENVSTKSTANLIG